MSNRRAFIAMLGRGGGVAAGRTAWLGVCPIE